MAASDGSEGVKEIVDEIVAMNYAGDVKAIATVIIDKDGDIRTLLAYRSGTKLPLIAGVSIMQAEMTRNAEAFKKDRD